MIIYNLHTHSCRDDGKETPESYLHAAKTLGLSAIGFTAHAPIPDPPQWCLKPENLLAYTSEILRLKKLAGNDLQVYHGLEIDYIPHLSADFAGWRQCMQLDYCIGSVHLVKGENGIWFIDGPPEGYFQGVNTVFGGDYRKAVTAFYHQSMEMVLTQSPDIIGHPDKVKMHNKEQHFSQNEPWYRVLTEKLIGALKEKGTIVELNTRGLYTGKCNEMFPSTFFLEQCLHYKLPVMVSTDAHHPQQLNSHFQEACNLLKDIGFKKTTTPFFETEL